MDLVVRMLENIQWLQQQMECWIKKLQFKNDKKIFMIVLLSHATPTSLVQRQPTFWVWDSDSRLLREQSRHYSTRIVVVYFVLSGATWRNDRGAAFISPSSEFFQHRKTTTVLGIIVKQTNNPLLHEEDYSWGKQ